LEMRAGVAYIYTPGEDLHRKALHYPFKRDELRTMTRRYIGHFTPELYYLI
jgi:hypothetical protein